MAAEPVIEPFEQFIPRLVPTSEPTPDPEVHYPGYAAVRLWDDVYHYGTSIVHYFTRHKAGLSYVMSDQLDEAIDSAVGATIKSLSGFINRAAEIGVDAQQWASMELDAMSSNIGAIYQYFDDRVSKLERQMQFVTDAAFPIVNEAIATLRHDMMAGFAFNSAADRAWATDNIFTPLSESIFRTAFSAGQAIDAEAERARQYTDDAVNGLGLRTLAALGPITAAVAALQTESEECTQPMCEVVGPKTDLGKLLKGLKVAAEVAALTAILNMNADDLAGLIHAVTSRLGVIVGDAEQFLAPGGETVAGLIADATRDLV